MLSPISVVIPAFNEAGRIANTLRATLDYLGREAKESELIVVDDGSTDKTSDLAREVFASQTKTATRLLQQSRNRGKGAAVRRGLLEAGFPIVLFCDADLSTPVEEMPAIVQPIENGEADVTFGSRALDRRLIGERQPWRREQAGRVFNLLVRASTGLPFADTQCGFKAFRMSACRRIVEAAKLDGFGFDVELLFLAHRAGLTLREIPVCWNHHDGSKVHFVHDSLRMLREVFALRSHVATGDYDDALSERA